ncbi:MAG: hypothetical protein F4Z18_08765 [Caldilineaceae bacterium SB0666_bin_21]|nr:hypothetical protein [Caldilineaceae bacterium SB0666_bin_21]
MWESLDYINPLIFLWDPDKFTLSVGLRLFFSQYGAEWALLMAVATMFTLPMIVVFFFAQRTSPDLDFVFTHPVVACCVRTLDNGPDLGTTPSRRIT